MIGQTGGKKNREGGGTGPRLTDEGGGDPTAARRHEGIGGTRRGTVGHGEFSITYHSCDSPKCREGPRRTSGGNPTGAESPRRNRNR